MASIATGTNIHFSNGLAFDLERRESELGRPIRVGLIGCGEMGTDIVTQCGQMRGITVAGIAENRAGSAEKAMVIAGRDNFVLTENAAKISAAIEAGKTAVGSDALAISKCEHIDVVVDATGSPGVGAEIGMVAMEHGKHLVMMNVEADVTIGLLESGKVTKAIKKGELLTYDNCVVNAGSKIVELRNRQDQLLAKG